MNQTQLSLIPGVLAFSKLSRLFILHPPTLVVQLMLVSMTGCLRFPFSMFGGGFCLKSLRGTCVSIAEPIMK